MDLLECKSIVFELLEMYNIIQLNGPKDDIGKLNMNELINDSLSYVTFIVALEDKIHNEIPDELLLNNANISLDEFCVSLYKSIA